MKVMYFFLTFYYMFLTFIPCSDKQDKHESVEHRAGKNADHKHTGQEDTCPPFCSCNCCGTYTTYQENSSYFAIVIPNVLNPTIPVFDQEVTSFFSHSIWQPPKIQFIS